MPLCIAVVWQALLFPPRRLRHLAPTHSMASPRQQSSRYRREPWTRTKPLRAGPCMQIKWSKLRIKTNSKKFKFINKTQTCDLWWDRLNNRMSRVCVNKR